MDINKFFQSKHFSGLLWGVLFFVILLLTFKAGMMVGFRKADFSCRWSDNYHRNFGGPKGGFVVGFNDRDFIEGSSAFGQIIKIDGSTLIVKSGPENIEKAVIVNDHTAIKKSKETIKSDGLKVDDFVVVIGEPNKAGQIEAKLIRLMPPLPTGAPIPVPAQHQQ